MIAVPWYAGDAWTEARAARSIELVGPIQGDAVWIFPAVAFLVLVAYVLVGIEDMTESRKLSIPKARSAPASGLPPQGAGSVLKGDGV